VVLTHEISSRIEVQNKWQRALFDWVADWGRGQCQESH
jgi:hypothetical protein